MRPTSYSASIQNNFSASTNTRPNAYPLVKADCYNMKNIKKVLINQGFDFNTVDILVSSFSQKLTDKYFCIQISGLDFLMQTLLYSVSVPA